MTHLKLPTVKVCWTNNERYVPVDQDRIVAHVLLLTTIAEWNASQLCWIARLFHSDPVFDEPQLKNPLLLPSAIPCGSLSVKQHVVTSASSSTDDFGRRISVKYGARRTLMRPLCRTLVDISRDVDSGILVHLLDILHVSNCYWYCLYLVHNNVVCKYLCLPFSSSSRTKYFVECRLSWLEIASAQVFRSCL